MSQQQVDALLEHVVRSSLLDYLDQRIIVVLRDGKKYIGTLRSFDQYCNLVLENPVTRTVVGNAYHDAVEGEGSGILIIRSDNLVVMGTLDEQREAQQKDFQEVSKEEIEALLKQSGQGDTTNVPIDVDEDLVV